MSGFPLGPTVQLVPATEVAGLYDSVEKQLILFATGEVAVGVTDIHFQQELSFPVPCFSLKGTWPGVPIVLPTRQYNQSQKFPFNIWPPVEDRAGTVIVYTADGVKTVQVHTTGLIPPTAPRHHQAVSQQATLPTASVSQAASSADQSSVGPPINVIYPNEFKLTENVPASTSMSISWDDSFVQVVGSGLNVPAAPIFGPTSLWWQFKPLKTGNTQVSIHFSGRLGIGPPFQYTKQYPVAITAWLPPPTTGAASEQAQTASVPSASQLPQAPQPSKTQAQLPPLGPTIEMKVFQTIPFTIKAKYPSQGSASLYKYDATNLELLKSYNTNDTAFWVFLPKETGKTYVTIETNGGITPLSWFTNYDIDVLPRDIPQPSATNETSNTQVSQQTQSNDVAMDVYLGEDFTIKHSYPTVPGGSAKLGPYDKDRIELVNHTDENGLATWTFKPLQLGEAHAQIMVSGNMFVYLVNYDINVILKGVPTPPTNGTNGTA